MGGLNEISHKAYMGRPQGKAGMDGDTGGDVSSLKPTMTHIVSDTGNPIIL